MGDLSHASGLWRAWVCMFHTLGIEWLPMWDHSFLVQDLLHTIDVLHVPGGFGWSPPMSFGGKTGQESLREAVRSGLHFTGTCYGAMVAMAAGAEQKVCRLGLIDGRTLPADGYRFEGPVCIDYLGGPVEYQAKGQQTMHMNGPIFGDGAYEVFGRFSDHPPGRADSAPARPIAGMPAAVAGEFGRGRVLLFSSHPEQPATFLYCDLIEQVSRGQLEVDRAVEQCDRVPRASQPNTSMLASLFGGLSRTASRQWHVSWEWAAQHVAWLATAKDLLASRLREERTQLERALCHPTAPALQLARQVVLLRLQQALEMIGRIDPDGLWDDPAELSRVATCFILAKMSCGCDLPQYYKLARLDYLLECCSQLPALPSADRVEKEREIAGMILNIRVRHWLDPMLHAGIACGLHEPS